MLFTLLLIGVFFLAWSNGANDNFKGVATLYGSGTTSLRGALVWATSATAVGSLTSVFLARALAVSFSGKGLIPESSLGLSLVTATGLAAALTILLATCLGMPTSTTHALTGALVGAGLAAAGPSLIDWHRLSTKFAQPLLLSPLAAMVLAAGGYVLLRRIRQTLAITEETCLCVGAGGSSLEASAAASSTLALRAGSPGLEVALGRNAECRVHFPARGSLRFQPRRLVDALHYLSGGAVCFARAVNDTPKIAALLLATGATGAARIGATKLTLVTLAMVLGGWLHSKKVAETMSLRITDLNPGQGLAANLVTSGLVLGASHLGLPVSTTHVSCSSIFGIGLAQRQAYWESVRRILGTWLTTLPLALLLGLIFGHILESLDH